MSRSPLGPRTRRRGAILGAGLAAAFLFLVATPAAAQLPGPVQDVTDTVDDVVSSDDPIQDVIDAVDDTIGDVTGTEDPIQDVIDEVGGTVDDVVETVEDTVDDPGQTVDDAVDGVRDTANDVVDKVDDATGGTVGDIVGGGQGGGQPGDGGANPPSGGRGGLSGRSLTPDGLVAARARNGAARVGRRAPSLNGGGAATTGGESARSGPSSRSSEPTLGERLREAAIEASKKLAVPLALTLIVLSYVVAQHWADRRDPKLVLAPVDADHDLLSFT